MKIFVNSTEPLTEFTYEIFGRGDVLVAQTLQSFGEKTQTFTALIKPQMAPHARVVVYYIHKSGEVVADAMDFDVEGVFQNEVIMKWSFW